MTLWRVVLDKRKKSTLTLVFVSALMFTLSTQISQVHAQQFSSGETQVALVELYTSEGCSSCPPADRWLAGLGNEGGLWKTFIPLAFHVDYWDYIGWADRFAQKEFSQRQCRYAAEFDENTVYTPGVRKNGKEWRLWYLSKKPKGARVAMGRLRVQVSEGGEFEASYSGAGTSLRLNIAVLGMGLSSQVIRGENKGKTLEHDFVVLGVSSYSSANTGEWRGTFPSLNTDVKQFAVAAWVTDNGSQIPIQATGGVLGETSVLVK